MNYTFRRAEGDEFQRVFSLILERMHWMDDCGIKQWNVFPYDEIYPLEYYKDAQLNGLLYVIVDNSSKNVVCAGILKESDERWTDSELAFYLHNFVSEVGRTGVGDIFLQSATALALEHGKKYLRLDSSVDNDKLAKYYEKQGFLPVGSCIDGEYKGVLRQKLLITD